MAILDTLICVLEFLFHDCWRQGACICKYMWFLTRIFHQYSTVFFRRFSHLQGLASGINLQNDWWMPLLFSNSIFPPSFSTTKLATDQPHTQVPFQDEHFGFRVPSRHIRISNSENSSVLKPSSVIKHHQKSKPTSKSLVPLDDFSNLSAS